MLNVLWGTDLEVTPIDRKTHESERTLGQEQAHFSMCSCSETLQRETKGHLCLFITEGGKTVRQVPQHLHRSQQHR